ncbi:MAG: hypothetical protein JKY43_02570 [Phycisphaerales bacterium]|nr:hypothetical protein [Phycisphaerales bacterium]
MNAPQNHQPNTDQPPNPPKNTSSPEITLQEPPRKSPWSFKAKIIRALWGISELLLWKPSPASMTGFRNAMLRFFGAKIGKGVRIHPSVKIIIPWHIQIDDYVTIHDHAILYALGQITIGKHSEIGPLTHLCAGTHDYTDPKFTLLRQPITIGDHCILGPASFVAPNVTLADHTILHPRAALYTNSKPNTQYQGNPAKPIQTASQESTP